MRAVINRPNIVRVIGRRSTPQLRTTRRANALPTELRRSILYKQMWPPVSCGMLAELSGQSSTQVDVCFGAFSSKLEYALSASLVSAVC